MSKLNCSNCKYYDFNACDGVDWCKLNHEETGICGYCDREFEDLEEATTHYDALVEENNTFLMENSKMAGEIKDLQSQLAEKEELKLRIKKLNKLYSEALETVDSLFTNQDKISFAIAELEKVKRLLNGDYRLQETVYTYTMDYYECLNIINEYIDNQIKQLKEGK